MKNNNIEKNINRFLDYLEKKGVAISTISLKKRHINVFFEFINENNLLDRPIADFNQQDFQKYDIFLSKRNIKESTKKTYLLSLSSFLEYMDVPIFLKEEKKETDVQKIVNYYFETKGYSLEKIKDDIKKSKIIYSRYTKPAKDLLHLTGSVNNAKRAIDKVAVWARSRNLDYAIETIFKKWLEIDNLKPKEKKKKSYYRNDPMVWSNTKKKWFVISKNGDWLEFAGDENEIECREE